MNLFIYSVKFGGLKSALWRDEKVQFRGLKRYKSGGAEKFWDEVIHNPEIVLLHFDFVAKFTVRNLNKDFTNTGRGGGDTLL